MADSDEEKTEEPTAKRLRDARNQGQVAMSRELNNSAVLFAIAILIAFVIPYIIGDLVRLLTYFIANIEEIEMSHAGVAQLLARLAEDLAVIMALPIFLVMVLAVGSSLMQVGILFTLKPLKPDISKLSPIKGLKRLFSLRQLLEFVKGLLKIFVVGTIGVIVLLPELQRLDIIPSMAIDQLMEEIVVLILKLLAVVLIFMLVVSVADYSYQKYDQNEKLKMTRFEVKQEYKQAEGSPEIKAKINQIRAQRHQENVRKAMERATILITNPTHYAVALRYEHMVDPFPVVLAKGQDDIALGMRKIARELDIPIHEDPPLARALYEAGEINQAIPNHLFAAVAAILRYFFNYD